MQYSILRFGGLFGAALGIGFFISHLVLGSDPNNFTSGEIVGYSVIIVSSLAVVFGIKEVKQTQQPKPMTFISGCITGGGISAIAGAIFAVYNWVYLRYLNPEFTVTYMQYMEQQIRNSGLSQDKIEQQLAELGDYADLMSSDFLQSMVMFATVFVVGLLVTVLSTAAMRTTSQK
jgi:hypothetical protein